MKLNQKLIILILLSGCMFCSAILRGWSTSAKASQGPSNPVAWDSGRYIQLNWDADPGATAQIYNIYRSLKTPDSWQKLNETAFRSTTFVDYSAPRSEVVFYRINYINENGEDISTGPVAEIRTSAVSAFAQPEALLAYDKNNIITNQQLINASAVGAAQIQGFLAGQGSVLANYSSGGKTAAQRIYDDCQTHGIGPYVTLTTLQKEKGLIKSSTANPNSFAMGWNTNDPSTSDFANQIYYGTRQFRRYYDNLGSYGWTAGQPHAVSDGTVTAANIATAGLYIYTPWIGQGGGGQAGVGGNYLFWDLWYNTFNFGSSIAVASVSDGFDYPVGKPDGNGWLNNQNGLGFLDLYNYGGTCGLTYHPGNDFNKDGTSGDGDRYEPVYAVSNGTVIDSAYYGSSTWGNVILIEHILPDGSKVWSQYGHLEDRFVQTGAIVARGDQIGRVGKGDGSLSAHLHFEIRKVLLAANAFPCGQSQTYVTDRYNNPIDYLNSHRSLCSAGTSTLRNRDGGPPIHPPGSVVKTASNPTVYLIDSDNRKRPLSASALSQLYNQSTDARTSTNFNNWVITVGQDELDLYESGGSIFNALSGNGKPFPDGKLIGYNGEVSIVTGSGKRRPFVTSSTFTGLGFNFCQVVNVSQAEYTSYPAGPPVDAMPMLTSSLNLGPAGPYTAGQNITGDFTIKNVGYQPITFSSLGVGGRLNGTTVYDMNFVSTTLAAGSTYTYSSQPRQLTSSGTYDFFAAYQENNGHWATSVLAPPGIVRSRQITVSSIPPPSAPTANTATNITNSSFTANWSGSNGATGYRLDVSTNSSFSSYVPGYQDLDVGNTLSRNVSGLIANTTYYYQVRAYNIGGASGNSGTISLTTTLPNYTITVSASPSAGGTVSGGGTFPAGSSRTVSATANSGYTFTNWTENGGVVSSLASYTFTLNGNRDLIANFTSTPVNYTITVSASPTAGGAVSGGGTFAAGSSRTVTATANSGYTFVNWTENGSAVSSSASYTFTLNANRNLVANFTTVNYTIAVSASPTAGGTVSGGGTFAAGSSRTVTATANSGYTFANWTENGSVVSFSASYTFTLNGNRNLVANFNGQCQGAPQRLLPSGYVAGQPLQVTIQVLPPSNTQVYAVEDVPPSGWAVSGIDNGGQFDASTGKVRWLFLDNQARMLHYSVTPPLGTTGTHSFAGIISVDGVNTPICGASTIEPANFHQADTNNDLRIGISEVTTYGAAWKTGAVWPRPPNPIPIQYVTNAGLIWKRGEIYHYDPAQTPPWVPGAAATQASLLNANLLALPGESSVVAGGTAVSSFNPTSYTPGIGVNVSTVVTPDASTNNYAVADQIPEGWTVSNISNSGFFNSADRTIRWLFLDDIPRTLTYTVTPPIGETGTKTFVGTASFDSVNVQISGARTIAPMVTNNPPTISLVAVSRQQGSVSTVSTIATVGDIETAAGSLVVTAASVPTGITITNITNSSGTVTANVAAGCNATIGANTIVLQVTDGNGGMATGNLTVNVTANTPPTLTYANQLVAAGGSLTINPATGPSDNGTLSSIVVQSQGSYTGTISVNNNTGVISLSGAKPSGTHTITIRATDNCGATTDSLFTLTVTCPTLMLSPATLPDGKVGISYNQMLTASGGTAPYTFALMSGALPPELTLAANGSINGTPTQGGSFDFTVKATDANNCTGTRSYTLIINKANSTASVVSSVNPSVFGQSVTFTATVAANPPATGTPSGTVTFKDGATTLCTSTLNGSGSATCVTETLAVGAHSITAVYGGDNNFNGSDSNPLTQTVNKAGTSAILTSSRNPSVEGEQVTFSATISAVSPGKGTPTGTVTFKDGATTICTSNLNMAGRADCNTSTLAIGTHQITAAYNGDGNFTGSASQALQQTVNPGNADLAVAISASPGTVSNGVRVTYDITVTNKGPGDATQVVVTDNLPASVSFISCSATNGGVCSGSGNSRTVTFASLPRGTSATIRLEASVNCANVSIVGISNTVSASSTIPDPNTTDNSATAAVNAAPGQAKLTLSNGGSSLDFGTVTINREPNSSAPSHTFTLENTGCAPVVVTLAINRTGADVSSGKITNPDDSATFPITLINSNGTEIPLAFVAGSAQLQINGGQQLRFRIAFSPLIPAPAGGVSNLSAGHVLPPEITSALAIRQDNGIQTTVPLIGRISTAAKMINPLATRLSPLVALARSGNEFVVEFSVFDSNLDCYLAVYQFLDSLGRNVGDALNFDLEQPIRQSGMLRGQSFTIVKRFTGASSLPQVNRVRVTLYDREGNESVLSGEIGTVIGRVVNVSAASFQAVGLASEAITTAFGSGLAASTQAATSSPLPTSLAGTRVFVRDSANIERLAPLFFVAPGQINYQIPRGTSTGPATVTVALNDQAMASATVQVAAASPGLFAANANGQGVAAAVALRVRADGSQSYEPVSVFDQAQSRFVSRPISLGADSDQVYLVLFGTGIRNRSALSNATVRIGGVDVPVLYAGSQEGFVGLDQVNLQLPRSLAGRGEVDILLTVDSKMSNVVKVNIY